MKLVRILPLLLFLSAPLHAAKTATATKGSPAVEACQTCHDQQSPAGAPALEGLGRSYLARQIQAFLSGARPPVGDSPACSREALEALRPVDFIAVTNFYSAQQPAPEALGAYPREQLAAGEELYRDGKPQAGVQPCRVCHGHDGSGGTQSGLESAVVAPRLAGQDGVYLLRQLRAFKHGERANDYNGIMQRMVNELAEEDFEAVSAYLATLDPSTVPPPPPAPSAGPMPEKAALCQTCHGIGGESLAPTFPKIGGLSAAHIIKQVTDIREGRRTVDVMTPVVFSLTDAELASIASYFAHSEMHRGPADVFKARRGEELFMRGNLVTGYPACMYCHGVDGRGLSKVEWSPGDVPRLAGQHPAYLQKALHDFKSGARGNDHEGMMRNIARQMTEQEIEDVSHYLYSLGAPLP